MLTLLLIMFFKNLPNFHLQELEYLMILEVEFDGVFFLTNEWFSHHFLFPNVIIFSDSLECYMKDCQLKYLENFTWRFSLYFYNGSMYTLNPPIILIEGYP